MTTRVKICGITRPDDARAAVAAGASAIGMVFWPRSPRSVTTERAAEIAAAAGPGVTKVGVFVDQPPAVVAEIVARVGLDAVQLHGHERIADYQLGVPLLKAISVGAAWHLGMLDPLPASVLPLLDAGDDRRKGGTGLAIDWELAAAAAANRRIVLAGGLKAENVATAIAMVRPYAVDVSSGVESAPGIKDEARIRAFVDAVLTTGSVPGRLF
ncbi:MAG TPA: phosphoribosylanthranilate isomerase [Vicinamibacterales bacterium]|nr:phosphoribosylanthranilate isomerase [Vicinamibacterales bacterium]